MAPQHAKTHLHIPSNIIKRGDQCFEKIEQEEEGWQTLLANKVVVIVNALKLLAPQSSRSLTHAHTFSHEPS